MISKAKGIKGFDPTLMQNHLDAVGRQQIDLNLEDISILDALSNKIGKRIRKFDDGIDQYRMENLTQPIAQVKKDFDRLAGAKTLNALRENFKTMKIGIAARIPQGYYEVIQNFPEPTRRKIYDSVAAFADEKITTNKNGEVVNQGPTSRELQEYLKNTLRLPTNATEGAKVRIDALTDTLRNAYEDNKDNLDRYNEIAQKAINTASNEMSIFNSLTQEEARKLNLNRESYNAAVKLSNDSTVSSDLQKVYKDTAALLNPKNGLPITEFSTAFNMAMSTYQLAQRKPTQAETTLNDWSKQAKVFNAMGYTKNNSEMSLVANDPKRVAAIQEKFPEVTQDVLNRWVNTVNGNQHFHDDTKDQLENLNQTVQAYQLAASTIRAAVEPGDEQKYDDILKNQLNSVELGKVVSRVKQLTIANRKTEILGANTSHLTSQEIFQIITPELLKQFELDNKNRYVVKEGEIFPGKQLVNFIKGKIEITNLGDSSFQDEDIGIKLISNDEGGYEAAPTQNFLNTLEFYDGDPSATVEELNKRNELLLEKYEASRNVSAYQELVNSWASKLEETSYLKRYGIVLNRNMQDKTNFNTFQQKYKNSKDIKLYSKFVDITQELKDVEKIFNPSIIRTSEEVRQYHKNIKLYQRLSKKYEALEEYFQFVDSGKTNEKEKEELIERLKDLRIWN